MRTTLSVIGLGASGFSAARLALKKGENVYVSDASNDPRIADRARQLEAMGARVDVGSHDFDTIAESRTVVASPGIHPDAPVLQTLRTRGVRWIGEPEYAVRFYQGSLIAITGTNGKTTTAVLTAHLLESSGVSVALGGNVGGGMAPPACDLALLDVPPSWYVLEMSSFQLADTETFAPEIGVVTNLAPDHLDRYPDTASYFADKARLFQNARPTDRWILNGEDPDVLDLPGAAAGDRFTFGWDAPASAHVRDGMLVLDIPESHEVGGLDEQLVALGDLQLLGRHNVLNALAASLAARLAGVGPEELRDGLRSFRPLPHRLEPVVEHDGVLWVNDSKATNVAAARGAIESLARPLVVLLGGGEKGEDYHPLASSLREGAVAAVLFGAAGARLESEIGEALGRDEGWSGLHPALHRVAGGLEEAVSLAGTLASRGDAVLLSPACSSFDQFSGYEERGTRFSEIVRSLTLDDRHVRETR